MPTLCLPVCNTPSPPPWPLTSADGEKTRRYSNGSSKCESSSKRTSSSRDAVRNLISVGWGISRTSRRSENVARQVFVFHQFAEIALDILAIDENVGTAAVRGIEGYGFQQPLHDGVQAPRPDVLGALIDLESHFGEALHSGAGKFEGHALGGEECGVLAAERGVGFG